MKRMIKNLTVFLAAFCGAAALAGCSDKGSDGKSPSFTFYYADGNYGVKGSETLTLEEIEIPKDYNGNTITEIVDGGFQDFNEVKKVTIPEGVTKIGDNAFAGCSSLTELVLPSSLKELGEGVFAGCDSLEYIQIPAGLSVFTKQSFSGYTGKVALSGTVLWLKSMLEDIPSGACIRVEDTYVDDYSFQNRDNIVEATITGTVESVGKFSFQDCDALESVQILDGVLSVGSRAFDSCDNLQTVTLGKNVWSIGEYSFYDCKALTNLTLSEGQTHIEASAFQNCISLKSVTIPAKMKKIAANAFSGCSLESVTFEKTTGWYTDSFSIEAFWFDDLERAARMLKEGFDQYTWWNNG